MPRQFDTGEHVIFSRHAVERTVDRLPPNCTSGRATQPRALRISVIVPTLNEQEHLAATLGSVVLAPGDELIVVDGGSHDKTVTLA